MWKQTWKCSYLHPPNQISCVIRKLRNVSELKMLALLMEA